MRDFVHFEGKFSNFGLDTLFWHVNNLEEHVFAAIFPLEGDVFVCNIEN
jgi:hypothetical protein